MSTFGQQATIVGTVTDPSGAVIPNVEVTIANRDTQVSHTFRTNDAGQYVAPDLPIGNYDLKAAASGFRVEETKGVVLNVSQFNAATSPSSWAEGRRLCGLRISVHLPGSRPCGLRHSKVRPLRFCDRAGSFCRVL